MHAMTSSSPAPLSRFRSFGTHVGHEIVCLMIAVLFCLVEVLVFVTDIRPMRLFRRADPAAAVARKPALTTTAAALRA